LHTKVLLLFWRLFSRNKRSTYFFRDFLFTPPNKWPRWKGFKWPPRTKKIKPWMTIKCPKFGRSSGPCGNTMGSDISLKENINLVGKSNSGINIYEFDYKDKKFGSGRYRGVMAQEVPQASLMSDEGYLMVDYSKINVPFEEI
jgi:hypothetical protein